MRRRTFDVLMSWTGLALTAALLIAAGLLYWGYSFADSNVHDQLAAQRIYFPAAGSPALASPDVGPYLNRYAGQQLVTGEQARAYADHFIAVHVKEAAGGKTYAEASSAALEDPGNAKLQAQVQTLFRGETLRGLLLNAYAFWKIGRLALIGAVAAATLAVVMAALSLLGFRHAGRAPANQELLTHPTAGKWVRRAS